MSATEIEIDVADILGREIDGVVIKNGVLIRVISDLSDSERELLNSELDADLPQA